MGLESGPPVCSDNMLPGIWCWLKMFGMGSFTWLPQVPGTRPGLESQVCLFLAGISWKDKVVDLRLKMAERNVVWFVVTALDEIACECSGFTVGVCYPVSALVLWESVCSCNSAF